MALGALAPGRWLGAELSVSAAGLGYWVFIRGTARHWPLNSATWQSVPARTFPEQNPRRHMAFSAVAWLQQRPTRAQVHARLGLPDSAAAFYGKGSYADGPYTEGYSVGCLSAFCMEGATLQVRYGATGRVSSAALSGD